MEKVWVSMRRSYVYQGQHYGPGSAVEVPVGLQESLGLPKVDAPTPPAEEAKPDTKGKGK